MSLKTSTNFLGRITAGLSLIAIIIFLQVKNHSSQALPQNVFYVSTLGKDTWSGRYKQPNSTHTDGPFATIDGAQAALRKLRKYNSNIFTSPITVYVRKGSYFLQKTILFKPEDSGTNTASVTYSAFPGEKPFFNGGQHISVWKRVQNLAPNVNSSAKGKLWAADISPGWKFNQLFLNGKRLPRSVTPNTKAWEKWFHLSSIKDSRIIQFQPNLVHPISNLKDVEVNFLPSPATHFINTLSPVEAFNPKSGTIKLTIPTYFPASKGDSFRVENTLEGIDQPGEWSLDSQRGKVYLWPPQQSSQVSSSKFIDPNSAEIIAPRLNQAILIQGDEPKQKFVHHIAIRGLTFSYFDRTRADQPEPIGGRGTPDTNDAVITLTGVENISIDNNNIINVGGVGIRNYLYAKKLQITNNKITNCGGAGVQLQGYPPGTHQVNVEHFISQNYITNCGQIYWHSSGISLSMVGNTKISANHIEHMPYAGILVAGIFASHFHYFKGTPYGGFRWGEIGNDPLTVESVKKFIPGNIIIEKNTINNVLQTLDDGGAIYLAASHNNIVRNNFIRNCPRSLSFGIYLDMDELNTKVENNIVQHCPTISHSIGSSLFLHMNGRNQVHNNIFIAKVSRTYSFLKNYGGQSISRNIFVCEKVCPQGESPEFSKELIGQKNPSAPNFGISLMDRNLYWSSDGGSSAYKSLALMQKKGFEKNSIVGDPQISGFDDQGKFHFKFNAPTSAIKFRPIIIQDPKK